MKGVETDALVIAEFLRGEKDDGGNDAEDRDVAEDRGGAVADAVEQVLRLRRGARLGGAAIRAKGGGLIDTIPAIGAEGHGVLINMMTQLGLGMFEGMGLHLQAQRNNLFIKIPGTSEGLAAIEDSIFAGVPVNVTLLFSARQYVAAAEAYLRGIERRITAGLRPNIHSVASLFISRWDKALMGKEPAALDNRLGIAVAKRVYVAYREFLASPRWRKAAAAGAPVQGLLWASTGTKDPKASDVLYIEALAAADTINTIPEKTLLAFADHGKVSETMPLDGGDSEAVLNEFARAGINVDSLAADLQKEGADGFVKSWKDLLDCIETKSSALAPSGVLR